MRRSRRLFFLVIVLPFVAACQPAEWPHMGRRGFGGVGLLGPVQPKDELERRILQVAERVPRRMNVPESDGRWLRLLAEATGAKHVVEIGTSTGYSGLWLTLALKRTGGRLTTFEIDPQVAEIARRIFREAGVDDIVTVVVGDAHETISQLKGPIDLLFLDADKEGYVRYLERLLPLVRPGGLIVAHNVGSRFDNPSYVDALLANPELESLVISPQMTVTLKKR